MAVKVLDRQLRGEPVDWQSEFEVPLRRRILPYLRRVRDELRIPIVYVSHDRDEIEELAEVVVLVENGRVTGVEAVEGHG